MSRIWWGVVRLVHTPLSMSYIVITPAELLHVTENRGDINISKQSQHTNYTREVATGSHPEQGQLPVQVHRESEREVWSVICPTYHFMHMVITSSLHGIFQFPQLVTYRLPLIGSRAIP